MLLENWVHFFINLNVVSRKPYLHPLLGTQSDESDFTLEQNSNLSVYRYRIQ
jgi:hypothetical protein